MKYKSTRGGCEPKSFEEVLLSGLASDGGLFIPSEFPKFTLAEIDNFRTMTYEQLALKIISPYTDNLFSNQELKGLIEKSYSRFTDKKRSPLIRLGENHYMLELFHGPTLAFKDFAMQIISKMFDLILKKKKRKISIITATSGDTGSAAVEAFGYSERTNLFVLYPHNRISELQRKQMTTAGSPNTKIFAVKGTFDDCQALVKNLFKDEELRKSVNLAGVNSINWARILAQIVYYFSAYIQIPKDLNNINFSVPTGNFGDAYAGFVAKKMGLPINKIIIATNQNDILDRIIRTGQYVKDQVYKTHSPAMDIQIASNFERLLFEILGHDSKELVRLMNLLETNNGFTIDSPLRDSLRKDFSSGSLNNSETIETIKKYYREKKIILCPHSAIGVKVAEKSLVRDNITISLATAHPGKFKDTVEKAISEPIQLPKSLREVVEKEEVYKVIPPDINLIAGEIRKYF